MSIRLRVDGRALSFALDFAGFQRVATWSVTFVYLAIALASVAAAVVFHQQQRARA